MRTTILSAAAVGVLMLCGTANAATPQVAAPNLAATVQADADAIMQVSHATAHLRKEASTKSAILATLKKGEKLTVLGKSPNGKWVHVKVDKLEGYVAASLLKAD